MVRRPKKVGNPRHSQSCIFHSIWDSFSHVHLTCLYQCVCKTRTTPLCCLFNEYKFYQRPPGPGQNPTWSQNLTPGREACRRSEGITTVSHNFCQPSCHLRLPEHPSPHQSARNTACDIRVQSNFLWSNPCMLPSLTQTESERKADRQRVRDS